MKLNILSISLVISLLYHSCQAAPLLEDVVDVTSDRVDVPLDGVHVNSEGIHVNDDQSSCSLLDKRQNTPSSNGIRLNQASNPIKNGLQGFVGTGHPTGNLKRDYAFNDDDDDDDDGEDLYRTTFPPQVGGGGVGYGSGRMPMDREALMDAMTKRGEEQEEQEEEEGGGDDNDASSNGENKQDRPGPPPPGLTDEQLDDFYSKH